MRPLHSLLGCLHPRPPVDTHSTERLKSIVREDEDTTVVRFEIIDGFVEDEGPKVFAEEFDAVEGCRRAGFVNREAVLCCEHEGE